MNWNSEEGRALLWQAYPEGYLATRGVQTVSGWTCVSVGANGDGTSFWTRHSPDPWWTQRVPSEADLQELALLAGLPDRRVSAGRLLPNPDPKDTATWACLLADLADAIGIDMTPVLALAWTPFKYKTGSQVGWALDYICTTPTEFWRVVFAPELTGERVTYVFPRHEMWDQPWHTTPSARVEALIRCRAALYNANVVRVDKKLY